MSQEYAKEPVKDSKIESEKAAEQVKKTVDNVEKEAESAVEKVLETAKEDLSAVKEASAEFVDSLAKKSRDFTAEAKKEVEELSEKAKDISEHYSDKAFDELKDPAISTTVLFTAVTASAASTYLTQQHKQGRLNAIVAVGVVVGVAALSIAEYFSVKAYFKRNSGSS